MEPDDSPELRSIKSGERQALKTSVPEPTCSMAYERTGVFAPQTLLWLQVVEKALFLDHRKCAQKCGTLCLGRGKLCRERDRV